MPIMTISLPEPDKLVSAEKIKLYWAELDGLLDHGSNALAMATAGRREAITGDDDGFAIIGLSILSPKKLSYQGLEEVHAAYNEWKTVRQNFEKISKDTPFALPTTKATAHRVMDAAFHCFDENPDNAKAKHYPDLLQQAAKILGLEPLGKATALTAVAQQWVNPPIAIS